MKTIITPDDTSLLLHKSYNQNGRIYISWLATTGLTIYNIAIKIIMDHIQLHNNLNQLSKNVLLFKIMRHVNNFILEH